MASLAEEVKKWIEKYNEELCFVLISFDYNLLESLLLVLYTIPNCKNIVLPSKFLADNRVNGVIGTSQFEVKYPNKIISTTDYGRNPQPSLFFGDFNNGTTLTSLNLDYFENVDREPRYRRYCRSVLMYRFTGNPPLNGYWSLDRAVSDNTSSIIFLKLSKWGEICQNIPKISITGDTTERVNILSNANVSKRWLDSLLVVLKYLVKNILETDIYTVELFSDENIEVWIKGFIHQTFNYIYSYESLEFLGDKICSAKFSIYTLAKYKRLTQGEVTEYHNQYMSADHQWYLSEDLHFPEFVLADTNLLDMTKKYKTDLFESFVGALYETCSRVSISLAEIATLNLFILIGEQFPFEKKMIYGQVKHRMTQLFESLGYPNGGDDFAVKLYGNPKDPVNIWYIYKSEKFTSFVETLKTQYHKDISLILSGDFQVKFNPAQETRDVSELKMWTDIARVMDSVGIDIRFAKLTKNSFIYEIALFDNDSYKAFTEKLLLQYPGYDIDTLIKRVQFKSNKKDKDSKIIYVLMYIHTFEVEPESKLLNSLTIFEEQTQKAGDDYIDEMNTIMQITNLAAVPLPYEGQIIGGKMRDPYELACYYCLKKFISH